MIKWFASNNLVQNLDKLKFITNNSLHSAVRVGCKEEYVEETMNATYLGLQIDVYINWRNPVEQMVPKLSGACYAVWSMVHIININTFRWIYCAYFHLL
jgi:hypothetical protein